MSEEAPVTPVEAALPEPKELPTDRLVLALFEWAWNRQQRNALSTMVDYNKWAVACGDELNFRCPKRAT